MSTAAQKTALDHIALKASDIIQKTAEVVGTLRVIDFYAEENPGEIPDAVLWSIRHAYRTIEDATKDAGIITDTSEEARRALRKGEHVQ